MIQLTLHLFNHPQNNGCRKHVVILEAFLSSTDPLDEGLNAPFLVLVCCFLIEVGGDGVGLVPRSEGEHRVEEYLARHGLQGHNCLERPQRITQIKLKEAC